MEVLKETLRNGSVEWEMIPVHESAPEGGPGHNVLKKLLLPDNRSLNVSVMAVNSVGASPVASLIIPDRMHGRRPAMSTSRPRLQRLIHSVCVEELPPVEELEVRPHGGQLQLRWRPSGRKAASEFVVEWTDGVLLDWQRESRGTTEATVRGESASTHTHSAGSPEKSRGRAVESATLSQPPPNLVLRLRVGESLPRSICNLSPCDLPLQATWTALFATTSRCIPSTLDGLESLEPNKPFWSKEVSDPSKSLHLTPRSQSPLMVQEPSQLKRGPRPCLHLLLFLF